MNPLPLTPYTNSKWIKNLNVKPDIIRLWEKNIGSVHFDTDLGNVFFLWIYLLTQVKQKQNKWDNIKFKSFYIGKETINEMERQPPKWKKIFEIIYLIRGWYLKYVKNSTNKKSIRTWAEDLFRHFFQGTHTDGQKAPEICSASLITREIQNKTTIRYHLTLVRMTIKKTTNNKC